MKRKSVIGITALCVALWWSAAPAWVSGGAGAGEGDPPSLTIFGGNLALVRMRIDRALGVGAHTVRIDGLPASMDPASLIVVGEGVTLSGTHGYRTYQDAATGPGASIELDVEVTRSVNAVDLAFLTGGLSWSADYAVIVAADETSAKIDGYASIQNGSGAGYADAEVQLQAGTMSGGGGRWDRGAVMRLNQAAEAGPQLQEAGFADYHLYTVSTPLTLRAGEQRRIRLMGAGSVKATKRYIFSSGGNYYGPDAEPRTQGAAVVYELDRPRGEAFGDAPLPAGQVHVYQRDDGGRVQLLGIVGIPNTAAGEVLSLGTGVAFDVVGTRKQTDFERVSGNEYHSSWSVELRNSRDEDVTVEVIEQLSGDWKITNSTHEAEKLTAGSVRFRVRVRAGGTATLEYGVTVRS